MQFTIRRLMLGVTAIALILAPARFARRAVPHFRRCRILYLQADFLAQRCRSRAARYRDCGRPVLPSPFLRHCGSSGLEHWDPASAEQQTDRIADACWQDAEARARARIDEEHRRAAEDNERIAEVFAAKARRCWWAAFRPWEATPVWTEAELNAERELTRNRDTY
jgi:hypothetical protein